MAAIHGPAHAGRDLTVAETIVTYPAPEPYKPHEQMPPEELREDHARRRQLYRERRQHRLKAARWITLLPLAGVALAALFITYCAAQLPTTEVDIRMIAQLLITLTGEYSPMTLVVSLVLYLVGLWAMPVATIRALLFGEDAFMQRQRATLEKIKLLLAERS